MGQQLWEIIDVHGAVWEREDSGSRARRLYFIAVFESVSGVALACVGIAAVLASEPWGVVWGVTLLADGAAGALVAQVLLIVRNDFFFSGGDKGVPCTGTEGNRVSVGTATGTSRVECESRRRVWTEKATTVGF